MSLTQNLKHQKVPSVTEIPTAFLYTFCETRKESEAPLHIRPHYATAVDTVALCGTPVGWNTARPNALKTMQCMLEEEYDELCARCTKKLKSKR